MRHRAKQKSGINTNKKVKCSFEVTVPGLLSRKIPLLAILPLYSRLILASLLLATDIWTWLALLLVIKSAV